MKKIHALYVLLFGIFVVVFGIIYGISVGHPQPPKITFFPQHTQLFTVGADTNSPLNIVATTLPEFVVNLADAKFSNLWKAYAQDRKNLIDTEVINQRGDTMLTTDATFNDAKRQLILTPQVSNQLKPGLYHLNVKIKTIEGKDITITQDFSWGVLAINTSKAIYQPGDTIKIGMGVLDDLGDTKCIAKGDITFPTAKVWLTIVSPTGASQTLSTDDGTIVGSKECAPTSITNNPDFQAVFSPQEVGKYTMHMTAQTLNGTRSIDDYFTVSKTPPAFDIIRVSYPTRIYPYGHYSAVVEIVANQDYSGPVSDFVPNTFTITNISDNGMLSSSSNSYSQITWQVNWTKGQTYTIGYDIKFPLVSPEFYLVGPLTIGPSISSQPNGKQAGQIFQEGREWQIASDAISQVQKATSGIVTTNGAITATFGSTIATGDLVIAVCGSTANTSITAPSRGSGGQRGASWTSHTSGTNAPRVGMYYRIGRSADNTVVTCTINNGNPKFISIYEYSGIASSGSLDAFGTLNGTNVCNSSPFHAIAPVTTTNAGDLLVDIVAATNLRSVNSETLTAYYTFNGATTGTFTTGDEIAGAAGAYSDTVTLSGSGGTCSAVIEAFTPPSVLTQNGYQFFQNANSLNTLTAIGTQNTDITLTQPGAAFRIRMLIDVDGSTTTAIGSGTFILEYAVTPISNNCATLQDTDWNTVDSLSTNDTPIAFNPNASLASGNAIATSGNDPTDTSPHAYTDAYQNYYQSFTGDGTDDVTNLQNTMADNFASLWDFSLIDNSGDTTTTTYCLRLVVSDGAGNPQNDLDSYLHYPQITTFYNEVNILGPGNAGGTTIIKGPGNAGGSATTKIL